MKVALFAAGLFLLTSTVRADISANEFLRTYDVASANEFLRNYDAASANERQAGQAVALSAADGMEWVNAFLKAQRKEEPIFCVPEKLRLTGAQVVDVVRRQVEHNAALGSQPFGFALLAGLLATFPCQGRPL